MRGVKTLALSCFRTISMFKVAEVNVIYCWCKVWSMNGHLSRFNIFKSFFKLKFSYRVVFLIFSHDILTFKICNRDKCKAKMFMCKFMAFRKLLFVCNINMHTIKVLAVIVQHSFVHFSEFLGENKIFKKAGTQLAVFS